MTPEEQKMMGNAQASQPRGGLLGMFDKAMKTNNETGLSPLQNFAAALDPLIMKDMRAGQNIRQQGAQRASTISKNKTVDMLRKQGRIDLANAVMNGTIGAKEAFSVMQGEKAADLAHQRAIGLKQMGLSSGGNSAFSQEVAAYRKAFPDATDAEVLEMIKDPAKMPAAYEALVLRAKDAGLEPGTQKYQEFMRTGGVGDATFAREQAQLRSEGLANLPVDIETSKQALDVLDMALSDEYRQGLKAFVGKFDAITPTFFGPAKKFRAAHNQIKGKTFMEAYKTLKGGGQITEVEGKKATEAQARLDNAQDEEDYIEALRELRDIIQKQYIRSQSKYSDFKGGQSSSSWRIVK